MATCHTKIETGQKQTNSVVEQMKDVMDKFLDDMPINHLDDKTLTNLYEGMKGTIEGAQKTMAKFRLDNGIKLKRPQLSSKDANGLITRRHLKPAMDSTQKQMNAIQKSLNELKSVKDVNVTKAYKNAIADMMHDALEAVAPKYRDAWQKKGGSTQDMASVMEGMTHQQRLDVTAHMQDQFPTEFNKIKNLLAETNAPRVSPERVLRLIEDLETVEFEMNGALDLANLYARNPYADAVELTPSYLAATEAYNGSVEARVISDQFVNDKVQNAIKHQFGGLTESLATKMMKSQVPGAQMFALNILETPAGFAGDIVRPNTASIRADMLHKRSIYEVNQGYSDMLDTVAEIEGWGKLKRQIMQDGHATTHPELAKINQDIMLHINAERLGRQPVSADHIRKYAEIQTREYHKIHDAGIGKVEGIRANNKIKNYDHQVYDDHKIMEMANSPKNMKKMEELFAKALEGGGMDADLAANAGAALMRKKMNAAHRGGLQSSTKFGEEDLVGMMPKLAEIVEQMQTDGVRPTDIKRFVDVFNEGMADGKPGYANARYNMDLSQSVEIDGKTVRLLDVMDQDSPGRFDKYSKEATGRVAIAEAMPQLNSDEAFNNYLFDVGKQAQLMGTNVDTRAMRNSLNLIMGRQPEGALPTDIRKIRDLVALAGMGGLGESQLAEAGLAMNRGVAGMIGTAQMLSGRKGRRGASKGIDLTPEQASNSKFMGELESLTGLFQDMHRIVRRNVHYDQKDSDFGAMSKIIDAGTGGKYRNNMKAAQDRFTGYGAIRSMQDQLAMAGLMQDMNIAFKGDKAFTSVKRFKDLGVDIENSNNVFFKNIRDHAVLDNNGNISELNIHRWSPADRDAAGIVLNRHAAQVVQKGFVGEMSHLMDNPWVNFMMQFRSYPMLAAEKQQARHLKFADKEAATGIFLNTVSSAGARIIRYSSLASAQPLGEREDYMKRKMDSLGLDTFTYMGVAGMTPQIASYATQLMGHPFGLGAGGQNVEGLHTEIPALSYATKMMTAHARVFSDEPMNDNDYARLQSLRPLGTIGFMNIMAGMFRTGLNQ